MNNKGILLFIIIIMSVLQAFAVGPTSRSGQGGYGPD